MEKMSVGGLYAVIPKPSATVSLAKSISTGWGTVSVKVGEYISQI